MSKKISVYEIKDYINNHLEEGKSFIKFKIKDLKINEHKYGYYGIIYKEANKIHYFLHYINHPRKRKKFKVGSKFFRRVISSSYEYAYTEECANAIEERLMSYGSLLGDIEFKDLGYL